MRKLAKLLKMWTVATAAALLLNGGQAGSAFADNAGSAEVQAMIAAQIDAFGHDDGATAYSFASPGIQTMFPSVDAFMAMVRSGYAPLYHLQQFQFSDMQIVGDKFVQNVEITAGDGTTWTAQYVLGREADGSLKIEACRLLKRGVGV